MDKKINKINPSGYGFWTSVPKWISYSIAPIMIVWLNWTSTSIGQFFGKVVPIWVFATVTFVCFFLFVVAFINVINASKKLTFKIFSQQLIDASIFGKALLYFIFIVLSGFIIDASSKLFIEHIGDEINAHQMNGMVTVIALFLLLVQYILDSKQKKDVHCWILFAIVINSVFLYVIYSYTTLYQIYELILFISLSLYTIFLFHKVANTFAKPVNTQDKKNKYSQKQHLIMFLSVLKSEDHKNYWKNLINGIKKDDTLLSIANRIDADNKPPKRQHPWEMNLRAIHFHIDKINETQTAPLKKLTLIASSEQVNIIPEKQKPKKQSETRSKPSESTLRQSSIEQAHLFLGFLKQFFNVSGVTFDINLLIKSTIDEDNYSLELRVPSMETKRNNTQGINFNCFEEVSKSLNYIINKETNTSEFTLTDTVIDYTSGQKPTSVAAILVATNCPISNQYVDTNAKKTVKGYNFIYANPTNI